MSNLWRQVTYALHIADHLHPAVQLEYDSSTNQVFLGIEANEAISISPDDARRIGMRLIEAAARVELNRRVIPDE